MTIVIDPSMMKSHSQAGRPALPSIREMIPAAIRPPNADANMLAPYRKAIRGGSSVRLYQHDIKKKTPGRNGASMRPRRKRVAKRLPKPFVNAWHMEMMPQAEVTQQM